ncbi:MAG: AraC family transcriptional regulator [Verrucomicrobia bacterium]|nr:MAG: AraC family transcriptional regulator [Verrucomicrobiota bacterium]
MGVRIEDILSTPGLPEKSRYSVKELADLCGICPRHFERLFKAHYGMTPHAWLDECRQTRALALLLAGKPIKDVAGELHYSDAFHFSRAFHQFHGFPPGRQPALQALKMSHFGIPPPFHPRPPCA